MLMNFKRALQSNLFAYRWWSIFYNPFHITRRKLLVTFQKHSEVLNGDVLDFGCGGKPYRGIFQVRTYVGCDVKQSGHGHDQEQIDFFYDGSSIPQRTSTYDGIFSSEVLEHVFNPDQILSEIRRVLRRNGALVISCPFFWGEHEMPYDYARYTSAGLKSLIERNGFQILHQVKLGNRFSVFFQFLNVLLYDSLPKKKKIWMLGSPVYFLCNLGDLILGKRESRDSYYLSNVLIGKKAPREQGHT